MLGHSVGYWATQQGIRVRWETRTDLFLVEKGQVGKSHDIMEEPGGQNSMVDRGEVRKMSDRPVGSALGQVMEVGWAAGSSGGRDEWELNRRS